MPVHIKELGVTAVFRPDVMSRKGDCWDVPVQKMLFASLKVERLQAKAAATTG